MATKQEIANNIRKAIIDTLILVSSEKHQLKYQKTVPIADVSAEIFCQWDDSYYPDGDVFKLGFSAVEMGAMRNFNEVFESVCNETPDQLPSIEVFIKSPEWKKYSKAAIDALKAFPKVEVESLSSAMFIKDKKEAP